MVLESDEIKQISVWIEKASLEQIFVLSLRIEAEKEIRINQAVMSSGLVWMGDLNV